jgi:predicted transposase YdaD
MPNKDLELTKKEITELDGMAHNVVTYSEDDRRKADDLYEYYQELISKGDTKGETRMALAKSLELKEKSANNLIEILKLKARLMEKKLALEIVKEMKDVDNTGQRRSGFDSSTLISSIDNVDRE